MRGRGERQLCWRHRDGSTAGLHTASLLHGAKEGREVHREGEDGRQREDHLPGVGGHREGPREHAD